MPIIDNIKSVLEEVRPNLQMDGGDVEFVSFDEESGELKVRLQGRCSTCPMSQITLQEGIGQIVKTRIPEVKELIAV